MSCFVPDEYKHLRWHIIKTIIFGEPLYYERAEWINDPRNGLKEQGYWLRWGYCGDFPSLCQAVYIGPANDQHSRFITVDPRLKKCQD